MKAATSEILMMSAICEKTRFTNLFNHGLTCSASP
jgi:hypothetical protein